MVELGALQRHLAAVVVPVHVLALAVIIAQGVAGGKRLFNRHFKH